MAGRTTRRADRDTLNPSVPNDLAKVPEDRTATRHRFHADTRGSYLACHSVRNRRQVNGSFPGAPGKEDSPCLGGY